MNQNEKDNQIKSSVLEENEKFKAAIASRDAMLKQKDEIIKSLQQDLGDRELSISALMGEKDIEKSLRIKAEGLVTNEKQLAKSGQDMYAPPKSKAEKFADDYKKACQEIRSE